MIYSFAGADFAIAPRFYDFKIDFNSLIVFFTFIPPGQYP